MTPDLFPEVRLRLEDDPNSRFTTPEFMAWIRRTVAAELSICEPWEFDLDPFAHPESHWGREWWTKADNAYARQAFGKMFVNGPWDECEEVVRWIVDQQARNSRLEFVARSFLAIDRSRPGGSGTSSPFATGATATEPW